jgi:hypothetical protein
MARRRHKQRRGMVAVSGRDVLKAYGLLKEMAALNYHLVIYLHICIVRHPERTLPQIRIVW